MGKKITQYTAVSNTNPDTGSLLDVSEKSGSTYASKKWSLLQLKTWLTTYLTLPFASLTSTPTTLVGYGITDAIDGSGTANYVGKFSDSNTLANSQIRDDGTNIGINAVPTSGNKIKIQSTEGSGLVVEESKAGNFNTFGVTGTANGITTNSAGNKGVQGNAVNNTQLNVGVSGGATGASIKNIGIQGIASGATNNYGARIIDGTEGVGKFLKSMTASGESNWAFLPTEIQLAVSDETTALTTGTAKVTFRMPYAMTLTEVRASLSTTQTSGSILTVDINESGSSVISTKLTIDNTEKTSTTATTPAVISDSALADDSEITIDIDQIGDGTAKGLKITLIGTRA